MSPYRGTGPGPGCPDCGGRMRKRVNRETGEAFWGCAGYPRCRGSLPWDGISEAPPRQTVTTLAREVEELRRANQALQREVRRLTALPAPPADLVRELTRLVARCHPDRWGGESQVATALTRELLALRARLQGVPRTRSGAGAAS